MPSRRRTKSVSAGDAAEPSREQAIEIESLIVPEVARMHEVMMGNSARDT